MQKIQDGFSVVEGLLILVIIGLVCTVSWYIWHVRANIEQSTSPTTLTDKSGWKIYKSSHSSVQFSYPSSWALKQGKLFGSYEHVTINGPHTFIMDFKLGTMSSMAPYGGASCTTGVIQSNESLNQQYVMVSQGDNKVPPNTAVVNLMNVSNKYYYQPASHSCWLSWYANPIGNDEGFTFSGSYDISKADSIPLSLPTATYLSRPEVQTARAIFSSFKQ